VGSPDRFWVEYDRTLALIRAESPKTFAGVKLILDRFQPPSSGDAFFPDGADDDFASALFDTGWLIRYEEGGYVYTATHPDTGAMLRFIEGDVYRVIEGRQP